MSTSSSFSAMHCDGLCPQQVAEPNRFMIALSLFPQSVDPLVPNKSILLFLLFLLTLSRPPLRPFLSDNELGLCRAQAVMETRLHHLKQKFLNHCEKFPLAGPIIAISLWDCENKEDCGTRQGGEGGKSRYKGFILSHLSGISGQPAEHTLSLCQQGFQYHFHFRHQRTLEAS